MNMLTIGEFVERLPDIVAGREQLKALFASYREINEPKRGWGLTGKRGLEVTVRSGMLTAYGVQPSRNPLEELRQMERQALHAQRLVSACIDDIAAEGYGLAVVYLGLTAFAPALDFARSVKRVLPQIVLATLTCDCKMEEKIPALERYVADSTINIPMWTRECGGEVEMAYLAEALIAAWPTEGLGR